MMCGMRLKAAMLCRSDCLCINASVACFSRQCQISGAINRETHIWNCLRPDFESPLMVLYISFSPKLITGTMNAPVCNGTLTKPLRRCSTRSMVPGLAYKLSVAPPIASMIV